MCTALNEQYLCRLWMANNQTNFHHVIIKRLFISSTSHHIIPKEQFNIIGVVKGVLD